MKPKTNPPEDLNPIISPQVPDPDEEPSQALTLSGRDEMNLAEFPFAMLRNRGDSRKAITYEGWTTGDDGHRLQQKWTVAGSSTLGLPNEFAERVYVALMALAAQQGFETRKTTFSVYEVLKVMGLPDTKQGYQSVEKALDQLRGVSIKAEGAFWDNETKELVRTVMGFGLIDKYWLRYREKDERIIEREGVAAYILWGEDIWKSIRNGYVKALDTAFYYSLKNPLTRRLFRLLDKRLWDKNTYDFDVFDLAGKLGMVRYRRPGDITSKLKPAIEELIAKGFLTSARSVKVQGYSRIRFVKSPIAPDPSLSVKKELDRVADSAIVRRQPQTAQAALRVGLVADLTALGVNLQTAQALIQSHASDVIEKWLDALAQMQAQGKAKDNPAGFLVHVLKTQTPPPAGSQTKAQKERAQANQSARRRQVDEQLAAYEAQARLERDEQDERLRAFVTERQTAYQTPPEHLRLWDQIRRTEALRDSLVFPSVHLLALKGTLAILGVPNTFVAAQVREHDHILKQAFQQVGYPVTRIVFEELKKSP